MAVDATGTPTSPDALPTYNTAADNPSGKGLNNIVAAIQTALSARVSKPAGVATGDVPVWNGTTWVVPSGSRTGAKFLRDDGSWQTVAGAVNYRKTTAKAVNTTVAATDLLNAEITVAAGAMGATGVLRLTAWGDFINNTGGSVAGPRLQLLLGGTTLLDTNALTAYSTSVGRFGWNLTAMIQNANASSQTAYMHREQYGGSGVVGGQTTWLTGEGGGTTTGNSTLDWGVNSGLAVNTAVSTALVLNVINGVSNALYETKLFGALVEII